MSDLCQKQASVKPYCSCPFATVREELMLKLMLMLMEQEWELFSMRKKMTSARPLYVFALGQEKVVCRARNRDKSASWSNST